MAEALSDILESIRKQVRESNLAKHFVSPAAKSIQVGKDADKTAERTFQDNLPTRIAEILRPHQSVLILSGPGGGKTTIWWLLAEAVTHTDPPSFPIAVDAHNLAGAKERKEVIRHGAPSGLTDEDLEALDKQGRLVFLVDGLNEIDQAARITSESKQLLRIIVAEREPSPVLATSRIPVPDFFAASGPLARPTQHLALQPFDEDRMRNVLAKYPDTDPDQFFQYLKAGSLESLATNPQMLAILIDIFRQPQRGPAPRSLAGVFERYFNNKWDEKAYLVSNPDVSFHTFRRALATLAWYLRLHELGSVSGAEWADMLRPFEDILSNDQLDRQAIIDRSHGLYILLLLQGDLAFLHERFTDYFAAQFLLGLGYIPECAWYGPTWEQTLAQLAGLKDDAGMRATLEGCRVRDRISLLCQIASANLGRLTQGELDEIFHEVATCLYGSRPRRDAAVRGLAEFAPPVATDGLRGALPEVPGKDRPSVIRALSLIRKGQLTAETFQLMRRQEMRKASEEAGRSRRRPRSPKGQEPKRDSHAGQLGSWIETLRNQAASPSDRRGAANALGRSRDPLAVASLLEAIKRDPEPEVRGSAANALGAIGDRQAVEALIQSLDKERESGTNVRGSAAKALGAIGDRQAVEALIQSLDKGREPDAKTRGSAANALVLIGDPRGLRTVALLASEPDSWLRSSAVAALSRTGGPEALERLKVLLRDPETKVRGRALKACLQLRTQEFAEALRERLDKDRDPINRTIAVSGLAQLAQLEDVEHILGSLWDPDAGVRGQAAQSLVQMLPKLGEGQARSATERLFRFWIHCRHRDTSSAIHISLHRVPPWLAGPTMDALDGSARMPPIDQKKLERWEGLREHFRLVSRISRELELLQQSEVADRARVWGLTKRTLDQEIEDDLRQFVLCEQENLWQKLATYGTRGDGVRNQKERAMQDFMETYWRGLGRGDARKELRMGSGRVDLWLYYGAALAIFELKMLDSLKEDYYDGLAQLNSYLRQKWAPFGALVLFAENQATYNSVRNVIGGFLSRTLQQETTVFTVLVRVWRELPPSAAGNPPGS